MGSAVWCQVSGVWYPVSGVRCLVSGVRPPDSSIQGSSPGQGATPMHKRGLLGKRQKETCILASLHIWHVVDAPTCHRLKVDLRFKAFIFRAGKREDGV